ncbi:MAG: PhzF family phenazine biosynthesis protein [Synergistaceae bacterium]|nr:PhzF family phenazine biosynthesis protein [Synergistaceae bacterium]
MRCYIVDAFADRLFEGNPAGVCVLSEPLPDGLMQNIAIENNLSETAFAVRKDEAYHLRWFTPGGEIDLCGHATLATAFVLKNYYDKEQDLFLFDTLSGRLEVRKNGDIFQLNFPSIKIREYQHTEKMTQALGAVPSETYIGRDLVFVFQNDQQIKEMTPDFAAIKAFEEGLAAFVTAPSKSSEFDFVARAFWPKLNINEDPVTGAMFCSLIPFWAKRLGKSRMTARQVSKRGGTVYCEDKGERVNISGKAVLYAISEFRIV